LKLKACRSKKMKQFRKIRFILLLLPMLIGLPAVLPVTSVMAQVTTVYPGETLDLAIEEEPAGSTYLWDVYCDLTVNFAQVDGDCPAGTYNFAGGVNDEAATQVVFNTPGEYMIKIEVWDPVACTNNMKFIRIDVEEALPEVVLEGDSVCIGDPAVLTFRFTGEAPWSGTYTDGTDTWPFTSDENTLEVVIPTNEVGTFEYQVTELTDAYGTNTTPSEKTKITVYPNPNISRIYQVNK
jgi:hypothetical protein